MNENPYQSPLSVSPSRHRHVFGGLCILLIAAFSGGMAVMFSTIPLGIWLCGFGAGYLFFFGIGCIDGSECPHTYRCRE